MKKNISNYLTILILVLLIKYIFLTFTANKSHELS